MFPRAALDYRYPLLLEQYRSGSLLWQQQSKGNGICSPDRAVSHLGRNVPLSGLLVAQKPHIVGTHQKGRTTK
jgi:hypothetical protein